MMKTKDKNTRLKAIHLQRFYKFRVLNGAFPKKYFASRGFSLLLFGLTLIILLLLFFFTDYKDKVVKLGCVVIFLSLYKIYKNFMEPSLIINDEGITFKSARFNWSKIKKIGNSYDFQHRVLSFTITSRENIITTEKVEDFPFSEYIGTILAIRTFRKKHRKPYVFHR